MPGTSITDKFDDSSVVLEDFSPTGGVPLNQYDKAIALVEHLVCRISYASRTHLGFQAHSPAQGREAHQILADHGYRPFSTEIKAGFFVTAHMSDLATH